MTHPQAIAATGLMPYCLRLSPEDDLKACLQQFTHDTALQAGCILTTVGSLQQACLRFAGQERAATLTGRFEIVSLVGTLSPDGLHLHLAIADLQGQMIGGHVMSGCVIYTTAEIVIGILEGIQFQRSLDAQTGHRELRVR